MYELIRSAISAGGYKLADMQRKIKKIFLLGDLTEDQADELLELAAQGICADAERPEILEMLRSLSEKIEALETRVAALGGGGPEESGYPAWKPWDGISTDYQPETIVTHNGQIWQSVYNGQNVWEPGAPGTQALWQIYEG